MKQYFNEENYLRIDIIYNFCKDNLTNIVNGEKLFDTLKQTDYVKIYFNEEVELIKKGYENYLG